MQIVWHLINRQGDRLCVSEIEMGLMRNLRELMRQRRPKRKLAL